MESKRTKQPNVEAKFSTHSKYILTVCFSPGQKILCSAGGDKKVILTNLENLKKKEKKFTGHKDDIEGSSFSSNGNLLATCSSRDDTIRIWKVKSRRGKSTKLEKSAPLCIRFSLDNLKVVSGDLGGSTKIWDIERKKVISTLKGRHRAYRTRSVDVLPNETIVSGGELGGPVDINRGIVRIWDFRSGKCVHTFDDHENIVNSVHFDPNSFCLASGSDDWTINIYDLRISKLLQMYENHSHGVSSVCFHPSGKYLLSGSSDETIKIYDLLKGKVLFDHYSSVNCVQFSPDGKYFASGGFDDISYLWNFPLGRMIHHSEMNKDVDEKERVEYFGDKDLFLLLVGERNVLVNDIYEKEKEKEEEKNKE